MSKHLDIKCMVAACIRLWAAAASSTPLANKGTVGCAYLRRTASGGIALSLNAAGQLLLQPTNSLSLLTEALLYIQRDRHQFRMEYCKQIYILNLCNYDINFRRCARVLNGYDLNLLRG